MELFRLTAHELRQKLLSKEISSVEITQAILARIDDCDSYLRAYLTVDREGALRAAAEADIALQRGSDIGPFTGIPIAVKDNICTRGLLTTAGSQILQSFIPPYNATVIARLRAQHAVIIGKTNMDEFGMGSSTENSAYHNTHNPWHLDHVPGGSSGGSAASVAIDEAIIALGSDTGGSIRQPASFCGVVGFKPTYGRVSRYGLIAYASSLDTIGVLSKDVEDAACLMTGIGGHDPFDATSSYEPMPNLVDYLNRGVKGLRIGLVKEYLSEGVVPDVRACIERAVDVLVDAGATAIEVSIPLAKYAIPVYYIIAMSEASTNLARYDGVRFGQRVDGNDFRSSIEIIRQKGFGAEVKRRIILGAFSLSAGYEDQFYLKAQKVRSLLSEEYRQIFEQCDIVICPASPFPAFRIGEKMGDPLSMYLADVHTITANLLGIPGLCVPGGFSNAGMPIGIQLLGRHFDEARLVQAGQVLETGLQERLHLSRRKQTLESQISHQQV